MAFRFDPIRNTVIIPSMNTMTVDPMIAKNDPPATISKIGFDCTIPWGDQWVQSDFERSAPFELGDPPTGVSPMTEDQIAKQMESLIRSAPQSWKELLQHFKGQNYREVYRAFGRLRPKLGRVVQPPYYPYAFSESGDFIGETTPAPPTSTDRLHHAS
jgi:2,5-furandicarboxylate decarboxylase 1